MKIGALYALLSVITWSIISVITRFCLLNYEANILVFASMQIFAGGVALLLIRKPVTAEGWKAGVGYSSAVHATANIPEFLSSRSLPVHHQY